VISQAVQDFAQKMREHIKVTFGIANPRMVVKHKRTPPKAQPHHEDCDLPATHSAMNFADPEAYKRLRDLGEQAFVRLLATGLRLDRTKFSRALGLSGASAFLTGESRIKPTETLAQLEVAFTFICRHSPEWLKQEIAAKTLRGFLAPYAVGQHESAAMEKPLPAVLLARPRKDLTPLQAAIKALTHGRLTAAEKAARSVAAQAAENMPGKITACCVVVVALLRNNNAREAYAYAMANFPESMRTQRNGEDNFGYYLFEKARTMSEALTSGTASLRAPRRSSSPASVNTSADTSTKSVQQRCDPPGLSWSFSNSLHGKMACLDSLLRLHGVLLARVTDRRAFYSINGLYVL
jgi:hypothetical protein